MSNGETGFAFLVRRWRHAARLTQDELAARSGLSPRGIQNLEGGRVSRPRRDSVRLLADALGLRGERRAQFELAARTSGRRGVTDSGQRRLAELAGITPESRVDTRVDLRGLAPDAAAADVLARLLAALDQETREAVAV